MPSVDLSSAERQQWHAALRSAFWNEGQLNNLLFLGEGLDVTLAEVTPPKPLDDMVTAVIQWAEGSGKTETLVKAAITKNPGNTKLKTFVARYAASAQRQVNDGALERLTDSAVTFKAPQQWRDRMAQAERRVCCIVVGGQRAGSGFLVAPGIVMTNYHVVEGCDWNTIQAEFDYRADATGALTASRLSKLSGAPIATSPWHQIDKTHPKPPAPPPDHTTLDFAILPLADKPEADAMSDGTPRGVIAPPKPSPMLRPGMPLMILQHPKDPKTGYLEAPDLRPLQFAFDDVIEINENASRVRYKVNSEPGSSGSPCFDPDWNLVALHHGGDPRGIRPAEYNEGIPIETIRTNLPADVRTQIKWA